MAEYDRFADVAAWPRADGGRPGAALPFGARVAAFGPALVDLENQKVEVILWVAACEELLGRRGAAPGGAPVTPPATVLVQRGEPLGFRSARWAWRCARTDGDHALLVSFMGRPSGFPHDSPPLYVGTARDEGGWLLVSVAPTPAMEPLLRRGRAVGRIGVVRVAVPDGWRGRKIVDAATGSRRAVFDGAALLRPAESGAARTESIVAAGTGDDRPSWRQWFPTSDVRGVTLTHIVDGEDAVHGVPVRAVNVRGRGGSVTEEREGRRLITRNLWWSERGATVHLRSEGFRSPGSPEDALGTDALVAFAEALV